MRRSAIYVAILTAVAFPLTACSATPPDHSTTQGSETATATPTPTIDPGPVTLTEEEAAERYLSIVCPTNATNDALAAAFKASEEEFLNGGSPDPSAVKAAAQANMDSVTVQTELFDDEYYVWPVGLEDEIKDLRDYNIASLGTLSAIVNAPDFATAYYAEWPDFTEVQGAAQEVRYQLGLGADTSATCVDHRDKHAELMDEKEKREAQLAAQSEDD